MKKFTIMQEVENTFCQRRVLLGFLLFVFIMHILKIRTKQNYLDVLEIYVVSIVPKYKGCCGLVELPGNWKQQEGFKLWFKTDRMSVCIDLSIICYSLFWQFKSDMSGLSILSCILSSRNMTTHITSTTLYKHTPHTHVCTHRHRHTHS